MSSPSYRPPLRGVIFQGGSIVGGVDLNSPDEPFIQEFNREYARLGLRVEPQGASQEAPGAAVETRLRSADGAC